MVETSESWDSGPKQNRNENNMPYIKEQCPICHKTAEVDKEFSISGNTVYSLKCHHLIKKEQLSAQVGPHSIISEDHKRLMPFQVDGVNFALKSGARCLIGDEMGLGKTIQALATLISKPELCPALIIVKSATKTQWQREVMRWFGGDHFAQVIEGSNDHLIPGLTAYITSYDLLPRIMKLDRGQKLIEKLKAIGIRTLILDECQQIKNPEASRSVSVRILAKQFDHVIALSGTPIKNNAGEYFSILNILNPTMFPSYQRYVNTWCDYYNNGWGVKVAGLRYPDAFKTKTSSFIIRREREDVLPDLPQVTRNFNFENLSAAVEKQYAATLTNFMNELDNTKFNSSIEKAGCILSYMNKMRHLTGISKISQAIPFVEDFIEDTDRKIVIFTHHKDVMEILGKRLQDSPIIKERNVNLLFFRAGDSSEVIDQFKNEDNNRILIASTLAAGEGLNMQFASDCIILERQWNPANEEQAEARFIRIGQMASKVTATYLVAIGTIDEYFAELVERKREIVTSTLSDKEATDWDQTSIMAELTDKLRASNLQRWKL